MSFRLWVVLSVLAPLPLAPAAPQAQVQASASSKIWIGRYGEFEEFIRSARIERIKDIDTGVTKPRHAYFAPGGLTGGVVIKDIPPGRSKGYWESYKSEIAAYKVDRLLELDMVPPTVERNVDGHDVSAQLFAENMRTFGELKTERPPNGLKWGYEINRQKVFDNLINNIDDNAGNLLVDPQWNIILVDHSRCFTASDKMVFPMTQIDRPLFDKLKALDKATLEKEIGRLVPPGSSIDSMLKRRDVIVATFEKIAKEKGEQVAFTAYKPL